MIKSKDELLADIKTRIGDDTSDEAIALIENISDTIADLESKANDTTDWKAKYEENDNAWRTKYRERFFNSESQQEDDEELKETETPQTFDDLFKVKEN